MSALDSLGTLDATQDVVDAAQDWRAARGRGAGAEALAADRLLAALERHDASEAHDAARLDRIAEQYDDAADLATALACDNASRAGGDL